MSIKRSLVATVTAGGITLVGFGLPALAQDASDDDVTGPEVTENERPTDEEIAERQAEREANREERAAEFASRLGERLGVAADEVATAIDEVRTEMKEEHQAEKLAALDQKLDDGEITQEQYDAIQERIESGERFGRRGHRGHRGPGAPSTATDDAPAEAATA